jgi:hypothetical protein
VYQRLGRPVPTSQPRGNLLKLELANGSRILSLPGSDATVRGYSSVALLIIDEAARVPDELYFAVRPMLAVSGGRLIALSTPFGRRGWWYDEWHGGGDWKRVRIIADECPRIPRDFLEQERKDIGPRWYAQDYGCSFEDMIGAVFSGDAIDNMIVPGTETLEFPT